MTVRVRCGVVLRARSAIPEVKFRRWDGGCVGGKFVAYHFEDGADRVIENSKANIASACQIKNLNTFLRCSRRMPPVTTYNFTGKQRLGA